MIAPTDRTAEPPAVHTPAPPAGAEPTLVAPVPGVGSPTPAAPALARGQGAAGPTCRNCPAVLIPRRTRRGLCDACYQRWDRAGRGDTIPAPMPRDEAARRGRERASAAKRQARAENKAALAGLLAAGMPLKMAARMIGVAHCTAARYRQELNQEAS